MSAPDWWWDIDDPLARYVAATRAQGALVAQVEEMTDLRARAVADLHVDGWSMARIAGALGVSRGRAHQLVERGRDVTVTRES
jgi:DNA-directed RNA polymerase specialized sigma24 family protein